MAYGENTLIEILGNHREINKVKSWKEFNVFIFRLYLNNGDVMQLRWYDSEIENDFERVVRISLKEIEERVKNRCKKKNEESEKNNMKLKDTVETMNSEDYKERFKAEYWQTKIRYERLRKMLISWEAGTLDFKPTTPIQDLVAQKDYMEGYLEKLELRAEYEGVEL